MARIKILLVVGSNLMHGTERYVVDLARHLSRDKFSVTVATPEKGTLSEILASYNINEFVYNNGILNTFSWKGIVNLIKYLLKNRYDIIHSNFSIVPNIIGRLLGVKLNIEIKHGILIPDEILNNMTFRKKMHEKIKEYFVDCFIAISTNDKAKMVEYFGISGEKIKVIYNGIDIDNIIEYRKNKDEISESNKKEILIGTIGRFTYQKAHNILIEAFKKALPECPNARLVILGVGEDENELNEIISSNKMQDKIMLEKYKKNVYSYINKFDIFILTSRFEGVPYVLLESMIIGIPIISTKVGGIDNVLENNKTALLVENGNIEEIVRAIVRLYKNSALRAKLSENAFQEIQKYSVEKMVKNVENLYLKYF